MDYTINYCWREDHKRLKSDILDHTEGKSLDFGEVPQLGTLDHSILLGTTLSWDARPEEALVERVPYWGRPLVLCVGSV